MSIFKITFLSLLFVLVSKSHSFYSPNVTSHILQYNDNQPCSSHILQYNDNQPRSSFLIFVDDVNDFPLKVVRFVGLSSDFPSTDSTANSPVNVFSFKGDLFIVDCLRFCNACCDGIRLSLSVICCGLLTVEFDRGCVVAGGIWKKYN